MVIPKILPSRFESIKQLLDSIAKKKKIGEYSLEISEGCEKGDGYSGEKHSAVIKGKTESLRVFIKGAVTDEGAKKVMDPHGMFNIEVVFYDYIFPALKKLESEKKVSSPFESVTDALATNIEYGNEIIVMPNIRDMGFELWERSRQMDGEHAAFVFREYGKFHALVYALKEQKPHEYQHCLLKLNPEYNIILDCLKSGMGDIIRSMADKGRGIFDEVESDISKRYGAYADNVVDKFKYLASKQDRYSIITHGDCWFNNMMFKYDDPDKSKPSHMCLIDFQLTREASPVCDLSYFMYASCSKEVYNDLDTYLRIYHESLSQHLRELDCDPEQMLPFDVLEKQWPENCHFGFLMALVVLKIAVAEKEERLDISESIEMNNDPLAGFTMAYKNDDIYFARLRDLVEHMYEKEFL